MIKYFIRPITYYNKPEHLTSKTPLTVKRILLFVTMVFLGLLSGALFGCDAGRDSQAPILNPENGKGLTDRGAVTEPVHLGASENFVIITTTDVVSVSGSTIIGNIFEPSMSFDSGDVMLSMEKAYRDAADRKPDHVELNSGNLDGLNLMAGVYSWNTDVVLTNTLTLNGGSEDVWIFQVAGTLSLTADAEIKLSGGALAKNIFWQTAGPVELGPHSHFEGVVLSTESVDMKMAATAKARLFSQKAVNLMQNRLTEP